jgi:hypothetical protein
MSNLYSNPEKIVVLKSVTAAVLKGFFSICHRTEIGKPDPVAQMGESPDPLCTFREITENLWVFIL